MSRGANAVEISGEGVSRTQRGGEDVSRRTHSGWVSSTQGGSPRKQTQCTKAQGKSRVVQARSGVGRAPEAAAEQDRRSSVSTQPPPLTHQKQAPPLLSGDSSLASRGSEHPRERTEAGRGTCREDQGGGRETQGDVQPMAWELRALLGGHARKGPEVRQPATLDFLPGGGRTGCGSLQPEPQAWLEPQAWSQEELGEGQPLGPHSLSPPVWVSTGHR